MPNITPIAHETVQAVFTAAFRRHVGSYDAENKAITIADLSKATRIKRRTLEAYRDGETLPGMVNLIAIMAHLPATFANEIHALAGIGKAEKLSPGAVTIHQAMAHASAVLAQHADHMADGILDHREAKKDLDAMTHLQETLQNAIATVDKVHQFPAARKRAGGAA
ncbi:hypothetical protein [Thalassospira xiamenensis]|uniref:hypothetical protein n=1 Tax=Thalassospira xiamenensis TaxID=220697 RepID=UPI000DED820A|nr:hypothetical protein [Thalassospira xiamenensis]RCK40465.1 hypothetical protein TH24_11035 [Thalassospira xiamenensis]